MSSQGSHSALAAALLASLALALALAPEPGSARNLDPSDAGAPAALAAALASAPAALAVRGSDGRLACPAAGLPAPGEGPRPPTASAHERTPEHLADAGLPPLARWCLAHSTSTSLV